MAKSASVVLATVIAGIILTVTTMAALSSFKIIPLNGTIATVNVEAYSDAACTQPCTALNVGAVAPGSIVTQTIYIKNVGTLPVTLTMTSSPWSPSDAGSYLTLSWNRENYVLNAGLSVQADFVLTVESNTGSLTTFSCNVTIIANE